MKNSKKILSVITAAITALSLTACNDVATTRSPFEIFTSGNHSLEEQVRIAPEHSEETVSNSAIAVYETTESDFKNGDGIDRLTSKLFVKEHTLYDEGASKTDSNQSKIIQLTSASSSTYILYRTNSDGTAKITGVENPKSTLTIPETLGGCKVTEIGKDAFEDCTSLKSVILPEGIGIIDEGAFAGCTNLTYVNIPNSVKEIRAHAFNSCRSLPYIEIPKTLTFLDTGVFWECNSLKKIYYGGSRTAWNKLVKYYLDGVLSFKYTEGSTVYHYSPTIYFDSSAPARLNYSENSDGTLTITGIASDEIKTEITIPDKIDGKKVTEIKSYAFFRNKKLTSISIPISIESIGYNAFGSCSNLCEIRVEGFGEKYYSNNGILFEKRDGKIVLIAYPMGKSDTTYTIPNDVTGIGDDAFKYCKNLTSITFPRTVTSIGDDAFGGCEGLTSVNIPDSVASIGERAFEFCSNLTTVTIPDSITLISDGMFCGCSKLTSVTIPDSVTSIGNSAFYNSGLKTVIIPDSVTSIGVGALSYCNDLTSVYISNSVTKFGISEDAMVNPAFSPFDQSDIKDIYYSGTQNEWEKLLADSKWDGEIFGTYTPTVHFNSHIPGQKLPAPTSLSADSGNSPTTITLTWDKVEYATSYKVTYWKSDEHSEVVTAKTATNFIKLEGLSPNTKYTFVVVALEDDTEGEGSEEYNFETAPEESLPTSESDSDTNESSSDSIDGSSVEENVNDNSNISSEGNSFNAIFIIVPIIVVAIAVAVVVVIIVLKKRKQK